MKKSVLIFILGLPAVVMLPAAVMAFEKISVPDAGILWLLGPALIVLSIWRRKK